MMEKKKIEQKHIYRGGTLNALDAMLELVSQESDVEELMKLIEVAEEKNSRVRYIDEEGNEQTSGCKGGHLLFCQPSEQERSNSILLASLAEGLKKGELATEYFHITPQYLSMLIKPGYQNKVTQELIISAVLIPNQPVSLEDVNHILMEVMQPGLFDATGDLVVNRRNRALIGLVNYAQDHACPRDRWLTFAHEMLAYLKMEPLYRRGQSHSLEQLTEDEMALFEDWVSREDTVDARSGYMKFRNECFVRYQTREGLTGSAAQARIGKKAFIGADSVKNLLCSSRMSTRTRGSRETLVRMAIEMGCDLDEANRILMEAGYPLLYPFRDNDEERRYIFSLLKNRLRNKR